MVTFTNLGRLGRFGNQLWQIAATIGYSRQYGVQYAIPEWQYAKHFNGRINQSKTFRRLPVIKEKSFSYNKLPRMNGADLFGYFQSIKYWKHCESEIRELFKPNFEISRIIESNKDFNNTNTCSVHIRRGDYIKHIDYHSILPIDYYKEAMDQINADLYLVFSDDIDWCKKNIQIENARFISTGSDVIDWFMMSSCKNHIIANSSYSWWASYLSENENKKIIAPNKNLWFGKGYSEYKLDDLYLPQWITI